MCPDQTRFWGPRGPRRAVLTSSDPAGISVRGAERESPSASPPPRSARPLSEPGVGGRLSFLRRLRAALKASVTLFPVRAGGRCLGRDKASVAGIRPDIRSARRGRLRPRGPGRAAGHPELQAGRSPWGTGGEEEELDSSNLAKGSSVCHSVSQGLTESPPQHTHTGAPTHGPDWGKPGHGSLCEVWLTGV